MSDLQRMQDEYRARKQRLARSKVYSPFNEANLFIQHQRQRGILKLLRKAGIEDLKTRQILEVGCGGGSMLVEFMNLGARQNLLHGIELIYERAQAAHTRLPGARIACCDGQSLPFTPAQFDVVMQFMAFSSILDPCIRQAIAQEMLRVVKPDGVILWYDFWTNPTNRQTQGIRPKEIRKIFAGSRFTFQRITLAPPLARRLVPVSWMAAMLLEKLALFNSHYLVAIEPGGARASAV